MNDDHDDHDDFGFWVPVIILAVIVLALLNASAHSAVFPTKYDSDILRAAGRYLPGVPWRLYKAQLWQESRLDPAARSPAGAEGIAQFMPATWREIAPFVGAAGLPRSAARQTIEGGAYYMGRLRHAWSAPRSENDRHRLALASYNAGLGNLLLSQQHCGNPATYDAIVTCLPQVTGRYADETLAYAPAIYRWWQQMELAR